MSELLTVDGLRVRYPGTAQDSLAGVSLQLDEGRVLGVVGESGSGKTTLGMAVLGLLPRGTRVSGDARVAGTELVGARESRLRPLRGRILSTIVQNPATALNPSFSIGSQIVALLRRHRRLGREQATALAIDWLRRVGFADPEQRMRAYPHQLSGGMNQRVVIAMALALEPRLVVADEPTSALDVTVQAAVLTLLKSLIADAGASMLLITHDLGVVAQMCDDVVVMRSGEIVERGPVDRIFDAPEQEYTRLLLDALPERRHERRAAS
jgi:ABC-type dipeptide/oligopeptide/nickel transport system ATPase component